MRSRQIYIKAVNTDQRRPLLTSISLQGAELAAPSAEVESLMADSLSAFNSFATPSAVRVKSWTVRAVRGLSVELPKHSVSVITLLIK